MRLTLFLTCLLLTACASRPAALDGTCFGIRVNQPVAGQRQPHPRAVWLLSNRHGRQNEDKLMLRLPASVSPTAPRYWQAPRGDSVFIRVLGGFWGEYLHLTRNGD